MDYNLYLNIIRSIIDGFIVGFLASVPLGPIGVLCIQRTLNRGRRSGFVSGLGAASSDLIYAIIAGFSVSMVMNFVEEQKHLLSIVGAIILIGLGLKIYFTNPAKQMRRQQQRQRQYAQHQRRGPNLWQDYLSTFFLTITNPLAIFLFLTGFSLVGGERSFLLQTIMLGGVFLGASTWWFVLTMLVGLFRKKLTLKRLYYINKTAGAIIIVLVIAALIGDAIKRIIV